MRLLPALLALALLAGCPSDTVLPAPDETPEPTPDGPPECEEFWGPDVPGRIFVEAGATGGDGSAAAPFADLADAIALARSGGSRSIVMGPGAYAGSFELSNEDPSWLDSGLEIRGCGRGVTVIEGVELPDPDTGELKLQPIFDVWGESTADVAIRHLETVGGRRAIRIRSAAGFNGPIVVEDVFVTAPVRTGVYVQGEITASHLEGVDVADVVEEGGFGTGIAIYGEADGLSDLVSRHVVLGGSITNARGVGLLAEKAWVDVTGLVVTDTVAVDDESPGRGIQYQWRSQGTLDGVEVTGSSDAAVHLHKPGRPGTSVAILDATLGAAVPATLPDGTNSGDGISVSPGLEAEDPASLQVILDGGTIEGTRTGVLIEGATIQVGTNSVFGTGSQYPIAAQAGAVVEGIGGGPPPLTPDFLGEAGQPPALEMLRLVVPLDEVHL